MRGFYLKSQASIRKLPRGVTYLTKGFLKQFPSTAGCGGTCRIQQDPAAGSAGAGKHKLCDVM